MEKPIYIGFNENEKLPEPENSNGTHLQMCIEIKYSKIIEVLGEPNEEGDGYKVDAEWLIQTPKGPVSIYNYKDGKNYNGEKGLDVEDITEWHIGGRNQESAGLIADYLLN